MTDPSVTPAGPSRARKMRQDFIEFAPSHLPFLITNNLLKVPADDPALWARLLVMPFWRTVNQCPRYPTSSWRKGDAPYERDFQRLDQWWLAHRGESWRPVRPEAPQPATHG